MYLEMIKPKVDHEADEAVCCRRDDPVYGAWSVSWG